MLRGGRTGAKAGWLFSGLLSGRRQGLTDSHHPFDNLAAASLAVVLGGLTVEHERRAPQRAALSGFEEVLSQRVPGALESAIVRHRLGVERGVGRLGAIHRARDSKQDVVGVLGLLPSGKGIELEHQQGTDPADGQHHLLAGPEQVATCHLNLSSGRQGPGDPGKHSRRNPVNRSSAVGGGRVFREEINEDRHRFELPVEKGSVLTINNAPEHRPLCDCRLLERTPYPVSS